MSINAQGTSIDNLFSSNVHYIVPRYQRRYVWDETNWDTLWKDILFQLENEDSPIHFTGPIITRSIGGIAYEVIAGQQRLTTFQIILCVIRDLCETQGTGEHIDLAEFAARYMKNNRRVARDNADHEFKFVPTDHDRDVFNLVTSGEYAQNGGDSDKKHSILKVYDYFAARIREHAGQDLDFDKMDCLFNSITKKFILVNLELGSEDERPEQVFASINATGRKLSEFDYLRNDMLLRAEDKADYFYEKYWLFENDSAYWTEDKLDSFLRAFLMAKQGVDCFEKGARSFEVYQRYGEQLTTEQGIEYEFEQLHDYAETYKHIVDVGGLIDIRMRFYRFLDFMFEDFDTMAFVTPIVLFLVHDVKLSDEELTQVFDILESYIIRGLLHHGNCDDKQLKRLLNKIKDSFIHGHSNFCVRNLAEFLSEPNKPIWLGNHQVVDGLRKIAAQMPHVGRSRDTSLKNILGYILYRIELRKIEHWNQENPSREAKKVMFSLRDFLRPMEDDGPQENIPSLSLRLLTPPLKRYKSIDSYSIGNLVFCTGHLPARDRPFDPDTKGFLSQGRNADIILNQEICETYDTWDVQQIREREADLKLEFYAIWPPAEHFTGRANIEPSGKVSEAKAEPRWFSMLASDSSQPTTFVTYTESVELSKIESAGSKVKGVNRSNNEQALEKLNILFACSSAAWSELEPHVSYVSTEGIENPPATREEWLNIEDRLLQLARDSQVTVLPVTLCGHVLQGTIEGFDKDAIYMQIRERSVIVYRHGLYEFGIEDEEACEGVVDSFDETKRCGYIKSTHYSSLIFVHIREMLNPTVTTLPPNQAVLFDINYTTTGTGLSAINVELI